MSHYEFSITTTKNVNGVHTLAGYNNIEAVSSRDSGRMVASFFHVLEYVQDLHDNYSENVEDISVKLSCVTRAGDYMNDIKEISHEIVNETISVPRGTFNKVMVKFTDCMEY